MAKNLFAAITLIIVFIAMSTGLGITGYVIHQQKQELTQKNNTINQLTAKLTQTITTLDQTNQTLTQTTITLNQTTKELNQMTQKAKQEQALKEAKELELATEQERQRILNEDKDQDGLTYREELAKGTDDNNQDSDGDGINDKEDINPTGGGRYIPKVFQFQNYYTNKTDTIQINIHEDWYDYYKNKPRQQHGKTYATKNDMTIQSLAKSLKNNGAGIDTTISFIQSLNYVLDSNTGYDEYPKYPIETIVDQTGDCEDTSYLAAAILEASGYDTILLLLPGHMAVGVNINEEIEKPAYNLNGKKYYYLETTATMPIGTIPEKYKDTPPNYIDV